MQLQAENAEKECKIRELADERDRLLGILTEREESSIVCEPSLKFEQQNDQRLLTFPQNSMDLYQNGNNLRGGYFLTLIFNRKVINVMFGCIWGLVVGSVFCVEGSISFNDCTFILTKFYIPI